MDIVNIVINNEFEGTVRRIVYLSELSDLSSLHYQCEPKLSEITLVMLIFAIC